MKTNLFFAKGHSRNGDSTRFLKERLLHEDLSANFFPRHNSLNVTFSLYLDFLWLTFTKSNGLVLLIAMVILKEYLEVGHALVNQFVRSFKTRQL
ncbi:MAG: hypothetical protein JXB49_34575 [Bacteroidales bacterium]|nr:hypothetical protein [Bacteroidales bacterium]